MDPIFLVTAAILIGLTLWLSYRSSRLKNYPPGPKGIPLLGNIFSLGKHPHITMLKWKEQYGDVYRIYSGRKPMVILSNFNTVRKVFGDDAVTNRDNNGNVRRDVGIPVDSGLIFSQGALWKTHRRFALQTLRDLGMGKNWLEDTIITEVDGLCQALRDTKEKPFNPKTILNNSVSNVICALIFGKRFELTDPNFSRLTNLIAQNIGVFFWDSLANVLPFLMWFPNYVRSKIFLARQNLRDLHAFLQERVQEHDNVVDKQADVQDYVYAYQTSTGAEKGSRSNAKDTFDEPQLVSSLSDLFFAGTETTSTTTLWAFVFMIENPDIMRKVQDEIDSNVGRDRTLTNADRALLPYTEAVILEVQRVASLVPLGVTHVACEDITVDGYTIPKGTVVAANLFSIHRDPRWWKNPLMFDPLRFLDENMKLTRPDGFAPFSIGKRACLGEALAKMELFLFIANLLRCFTLKTPPGKSISREDYASSVVNSPLPFELLFVPRTGG